MTALLTGLVMSCAVYAQDSTAQAPGQSDALSAYALPAQRTAYVVDLTPITSSWGSPYFVGTLLKAPADTDPLFPTQIAGATAVSVKQLTGLAFPPRSFARWQAPGQGINTPGPNSIAAQSVTISGYSRQFGVAMTGVSAGATNAVSATVGQDAANPGRLYVTRYLALASRPSAAAPDTATLSLGGVDASGTIALRADGFNTSVSSAVPNDNLVEIAAAARNVSLVATASGNAPSIALNDPAATAILTNSGVTLNAPAILPAMSGPLTVGFNVGSQWTLDGAPGGQHLGPDLQGHRGNPTIAAIASPSGGEYVLASLARATGVHRTDALNASALTASGSVVPGSQRSLRIPSPLSGPGGYTTNTQGRAEFRQYLNQSVFRGPSGHVAAGFDPPTGSIALAAVATDPDGGGEAILVARLTPPSPEWRVVARVGSDVTSGPTGPAIGTLSSVQPVTFSAPAMDLLGNIYFVAAFTPAGDSPTRALIKAVRTPDGYTLERLLQQGQTFTGANSTCPIAITRLTLGDSDSIASGTFHAGAILQPQLPGLTTTNSASPFAFGGCVVNARVTYDNAGTPETYDAALFIGPRAPAPSCAGDITGDNATNTADLTALLSRFGQTASPGDSADLNDDGSINTADLTLLLGNFGCGA